MRAMQALATEEGRGANPNQVLKQVLDPPLGKIEFCTEVLDVNGFVPMGGQGG